MGNQHSNLKIPPQNLEAEMAILGSVMLREDAIYEIIDVVLPNSFYAKKHRTIFEAILDLFKKSNPVDLLSLTSRLSEKNQLDLVGGRSYLTELVGSVPTSVNIRHYADIVRKKHVMRSLIEASEHIQNLGYDEASELEDIMDRAEKRIFDITSSGSTFTFTELKNELEEAWERLDRLHNSQADMRGIATGFPDIDHKLAGLQKSDLIILAARPSMGKTSLALDIARQTAVKHGNPVGIFSLEMASQQLVDRMLAAEANVDAWKLRTGKLSREEDFVAIRQSLDKLAQAPIYIDDQPGNNILKMRAVARRLKAEKNLKLIIVDYLQLMLPTGGRTNDNMVQQVTEISRSLKNLARELDIPVLALSQLSRAVESRGGRPRLSDLRDSGSIEQDADVVMFIHREDKYKEESDRTNIAEILIEKHRNGETGKVELYFNDKKATFQSINKSGFSGVDKEFEQF